MNESRMIGRRGFICVLAALLGACPWVGALASQAVPGGDSIDAAMASWDEDAARSRLLTFLERQLGHSNPAVAGDSLGALRELRDPRLRPIFVRLAANSGGETALNALVALAELEDPARIDVVRIAELPEPSARARAVGMSLALGYLDASRLEQVLGWAELGERLEALLLAEYVGVGGEASSARLAELSRSSDGVASTLARLMEGGLDADEQRRLAEAYVDEVGVSGSGGEAATLSLMRALRSASPSGSGVFMGEILAAVEGDLPLEREALVTLAKVDREGARSGWLGMFEGSERVSRRFSLALVALAAGADLGEPVFAALAMSGDERLGAMGRAGMALLDSNEGSPVESLLGVVATKYDPATVWALERARELDAAGRIGFGLGLLRWVRESGEGTVREALLAYEAARMLASDDPVALRGELDRMAGSDEPLVNAMLRGVIESRLRDRVWSSGDEPAWGHRSSVAMAAICGGLFDLADEESGRRDGPAGDRLTVLLSEAAGSFGGLPASARVQAAWLALARLDPASESATRLLHALDR